MKPADIDDGLTVLGRRMDTEAVTRETTKRYVDEEGAASLSAVCALRALAADSLVDFEVSMRASLQHQWTARETQRLADLVLTLTTDEEVTKAFLEWHVDETARDAWVTERMNALKARATPPMPVQRRRDDLRAQRELEPVSLRVPRTAATITFPSMVVAAGGELTTCALSQGHFNPRRFVLGGPTLTDVFVRLTIGGVEVISHVPATSFTAEASDPWDPCHFSQMQIGPGVCVDLTLVNVGNVPLEVRADLLGSYGR